VQQHSCRTHHQQVASGLTMLQHIWMTGWRMCWQCPFDYGAAGATAALLPRFEYIWHHQVALFQRHMVLCAACAHALLWQRSILVILAMPRPTQPVHYVLAAAHCCLISRHINMSSACCRLSTSDICGKPFGDHGRGRGLLIPLIRFVGKSYWCCSKLCGSSRKAI
jgi:hypothetical protein